MRGAKEQMSVRAAGESRSRMRSKSTRKTLREISNSKNIMKSGRILKKNYQEDGTRKSDHSLDRLLLLNSEVSSLLRQIDELVFEALQLRDDHGRKEVKQFADVLSDMKASLKPWIPRFQKALNSQTDGPVTKLDNSHETSVACPISKDKCAPIQSPEPTKGKSLVSPSPLVSWRAECNTEVGKQLFLLTPMPQKKGCPMFETISLKENAEKASPSGLVGTSVGDLLEGVSVNQPAEKALDETVGMIQCSLRDKYSKSQLNRSAFVMTPFLNMSPPKSCVLLEPVSLLTRKRGPFVYKSTPFRVGLQNSRKSLDSESSLPTDDLSVKYPEILGIKTVCLGDTRQELEDSLHWIGSPPKTCSVMEPPHEKSLVNPGCPSSLPEVNAGTSQNDDFSSLNESFHHGGPSCITSNNLLPDDGGKLDLADCTPMVKKPMSIYRKGKHPGENTLKKELWAKFEAVSSHAICYNHPTLQKAAQKGFLDRLYEASDA